MNILIINSRKSAFLFACTMAIALLLLLEWTPAAYTQEPADLNSPHLLIQALPSALLMQANHFIDDEIAETYHKLPSELRGQNRGRQLSSPNHKSLTTCSVTTTAESGAGSLRQCLLDVAPDATITFDTSVFPPNNPATISLLSPFDWIITDSLTIDAHNAGVILSGSQLSDGYGLVIDGADGVTIQGLQILDFPQYGIALISGTSEALIGGKLPGQGNVISGNGDAGVYFQNAETTNNQLQGNYIGTDASGTVAMGNIRGIVIAFGARGNMIGGAGSARNIISGNTSIGVQLQNVGTTGNQVLGNYIGTSASGMVALPNSSGIGILEGAEGNIIGGETSDERNIISGNTYVGVVLYDIVTTTTMSNTVQGNYIGTDITGMVALPNEYGVALWDGPQNNIIGGSSPGSGNLISGNTILGVQIQGSNTDDNQVIGNLIGIDATGSTRLPNEIGIGIAGEQGIGPQNNIIGGAGLARNVISGNTKQGIEIFGFGTAHNKIWGNYIGTTITGTSPVSNTWGIILGAGAYSNTIGSPQPEYRNIISGNTGGIGIDRTAGNNNLIQGNYIGTDVTGSVELGNIVGIQLGEQDSRERRGIGGGHIIGGTTDGAGNVISGNQESGIWIDQGTSNNQVLGNYIGTDATGTAALGNNRGIVLNNSQGNIIGGMEGAGNLISGNNQVGILIQNNSTSNNQVLGNYIGTDVTATEALTNQVGIGILEAQNNMIGGGNVISGNTEAGIQLQASQTTSNTVQANYIGTTVTGTLGLGNKVGIILMTNPKESDGPQNNMIGGEEADDGNVISGNMQAGIQIEGLGTSGNQISRNFIGSDVSGEEPLGNHASGIILSEATSNIIGPNNLIAYNQSFGISADGKNTVGNTITQNSIHSNQGAAIEIDNPPAVEPPMLENWSPSNLLSGSTCNYCRVEIFANPNSEPAGTLFLAEVTANAAGFFTITLTLAPDLPYLSANTTDLNNTTSQFSPGFLPTSVTNTPTPSATATANTPTPSATAASTPTSTPTATPSVPKGNHLYLPLVRNR